VNPPILGYFADLLYKEDPHGEPIIDRRWITTAERHDLIGDGRIVAATFVPLIASSGGIVNAVAWLVQSEPGPYITTSLNAALSAAEQRANVTSLRFGGLDPRGD
jgi:hypothetical protein